jgi:hypothetical protein
VTVATPNGRPEGNFDAILLNGSVAVDAPEWVRSFNGTKIIVQNESKDIVWTDDAAQAAQSVQQLAEGQEVRRPKMGRSAWTIVVYVFAGLFLLQLLLMLFALGISFVSGF